LILEAIRKTPPAPGAGGFLRSHFVTWPPEPSDSQNVECKNAHPQKAMAIADKTKSRARPASRALPW
jgi:hypothetical protein